jgi:hypothetical protein
MTASKASDGTGIFIPFRMVLLGLAPPIDLNSLSMWSMSIKRTSLLFIDSVYRCCSSRKVDMQKTPRMRDKALSWNANAPTCNGPRCLWCTAAGAWI